MTTPTVLQTARAWLAAGVSVIPARTDGTKAPAGAWKAWTTALPGAEQVAEWFEAGHPGLGLVCGEVSGGLEMLELEGRAVEAGAVEQLGQHVEAAGLGDLWRRLVQGYCEATPSGGLHLLYRVDGTAVPGNTKLAKNAAGEVLAETRGEGGFVVVAPSHGPVHPTGQPWVLLAGQPGALPTITAAERTELHRVIRLLDEMPAERESVESSRIVNNLNKSSSFSAPARPAPPAGYVSPGDDFEHREDWGGSLLLGGAGWTMVSGHAPGYRTWRRPGKQPPVGISATTGYAPDRDRLYVMSTSTEFEAEQPYTKLGAYAVLHHGGDHSAAAAELQRLGYGVRPSTTPAPALASTFDVGPGLIAPEPSTMPAGFRATLLRRSQLRDLPPVRPLIHNLLSLRTSVVLVGGTGLGKTFLALSWACSVATGKEWLGATVERVRGLYVVGEGASGLDARVSAWERAWDTKVDDEDLVFSVKPDSLMNPATWDQMRAEAGDLGARFIVLDTFSSLAPDADETKDAAVITRKLSDLAAAIDGTALLVHHPGWSDSGRTRGGYQLEANVDEVLVISGEKDSDLIELSRKKVKEGVAGASRWLRRRALHDSVIIESASADDADLPIRDRILRLLDEGQALSIPQITESLKADRTSVWRSVKKLAEVGAVAEQSGGRFPRYASTGLGPAGMFAAPGRSK